MQPASPPAIPGHVIIRRIARGSYGEVWLAQTDLGEYRAAKVVRRTFFNDGRPYERELAGLRRYEPVSREHDGLVDILQVGCDEANGYFHYVMELADNARTPPPDTDGNDDYSPVTLASKIRQTGRLPVREVIELGITLLKAVEFLHSHRLIHRDIKPANIIFSGGRPKLADVGLVAHLDATFTRGELGTAGYIAPEGANNEQSDVYSLGKVLYEAATGKAHYEFPDLPTNLGNAQADGALCELNEVLLNACESNPNRRFGSASAMRKSLELLQAGKSLRTRRKRRAAIRWTISLCPLLLLGFVGVWAGRSYYLEAGLKQIATFSSPHIPNWIWAIPGRVDSRAGHELLIPEGNTLYTFRADGGLVSKWTCHDVDAKGLTLRFVADTDSDGRDEAFVSWNNGSNCNISEIKGGNWERPLRFSALGHEPVVTNAAHTSLLFPRAFISAQDCRDGRSKLIATLETYYGGSPRAICCFDYETRTQIWQRVVAPVPNGIVTTDLDGDGQLELLFGSGASDNGNLLSDGTDDSHSYVYAYGLDGRLLWRSNLGGTYIQSTIQAMTFAPSVKPRLIAWVSGGVNTNGQRTLTAGDIVELDRKGHIINSFTNDCRLISLNVIPDSTNSEFQIVCSDSDGNIHLLDDKFREQAKHRPITKDLRFGSFDSVNLDLIFAGQLAHRRTPEFVMAGLVSRLDKVTNYGNPDDPPNNEWYEQLEIIVVGPDLKPVLRRELGANVATPFSWKLLPADMDGDGYPEIVSATDKIAVLKRRP